LVQEEHLALCQRREDRGKVAGVLDRRAAGDAHRLFQLAGDDHGQRRLAEPGRTGEQDVVRRCLAATRGLQHQAQLVADPLLSGEVGQPARTERSLDAPLLVRRAGVDHPGGCVQGTVIDRRVWVGVTVRPVPPVASERRTGTPWLLEGAHRPSSRSAARRNSDTWAGAPEERTRSIASSACLPLQPSPTRASWTWLPVASREEVLPGADPTDGSTPIARILSLS